MSAPLLGLQFDAVDKFQATLRPESDRGCALIACAYLDRQIQVLCEKIVVADTKVRDAMFDASKPLGSFSARIDFVYLLGHIDATVRTELHLLRKIRNEFGHSPDPISFRTQGIAQRCLGLKLAFLPESAAPRRRFTNSVSSALAAIHVASFRAKTPMVPKAIHVIDFNPGDFRGLLISAAKYSGGEKGRTRRQSQRRELSRRVRPKEIRDEKVESSSE